jgi:hypothetical protein
MYSKYVGIFTAAVTLALGGVAQSALAVTDINTCRAITKPGAYRLIKDLVANGDCLVIKASNVDLDLNGHRLKGNGTGSGIFDGFDHANPLSGIDVRNGVISNFEYGVHLPLATNSEVFCLRVHHNSRVGISVNDGTVGFNLVVENGVGIESTGARISDNVIKRNKLAGAYVLSSYVYDNVIADNGSSGVEWDSVSGRDGNITHNVFGYNEDVDIYARCGAQSVAINGNIGSGRGFSDFPKGCARASEYSIRLTRW